MTTSPDKFPEAGETQHDSLELYYATSRMVAGALEKTGRIHTGYPEVIGSTLESLQNYGGVWLMNPNDPRCAVLKSFINEFVVFVDQCSPEQSGADRLTSQRYSLDMSNDACRERSRLFNATAAMVAGAIEYTSDTSSPENQINRNYPRSITSTLRSLHDYGRTWLQTPEDPRAISLRSFAGQLIETIQEAEFNQGQ